MRFTAARLFSELTLARADGSYTRVLAKIARADVLVIDATSRRDPRKAEDNRLHRARSPSTVSVITMRRFRRSRWVKYALSMRALVHPARPACLVRHPPLALPEVPLVLVHPWALRETN